MANDKALKTKLAAVKGAQRVTQAMEMVAASRMRKNQELLLATRPYADILRRVIARVSSARSERYQHPYLIQRHVSRVGCLVIATDRGLCGGLNLALFRKIMLACVEHRAHNIEVDFALYGRKAVHFFAHQGYPVLAQNVHLSDQPTLTDVIGPVHTLLRAFEAHQIDEVYVAYNRFLKTTVQAPTIERLLPLAGTIQPIDQRDYAWDYLYEPDPKSLLDRLFLRIYESFCYQAVMENLACEHAARMIAMQGATENAQDLLEALAREQQKRRQAGITQELTEIVTGATAVGL